jgi:hypothetical protein
VPRPTYAPGDNSRAVAAGGLWVGRWGEGAMRPGAEAASPVALSRTGRHVTRRALRVRKVRVSRKKGPPPGRGRLGPRIPEGSGGQPHAPNRLRHRRERPRGSAKRLRRVRGRTLTPPPTPPPPTRWQPVQHCSPGGGTRRLRPLPPPPPQHCATHYYSCLAKPIPAKQPTAGPHASRGRLASEEGSGRCGKAGSRATTKRQAPCADLRAGSLRGKNLAERSLSERKQ